MAQTTPARPNARTICWSRSSTKTAKSEGDCGAGNGGGGGGGGGTDGDGITEAAGGCRFDIVGVVAVAVAVGVEEEEDGGGEPRNIVGVLVPCDNGNESRPGEAGPLAWLLWFEYSEWVCCCCRANGVAIAPPGGRGEVVVLAVAAAAAGGGGGDGRGGGGGGCGGGDALSWGDEDMEGGLRWTPAMVVILAWWLLASCCLTVALGSWPGAAMMMMTMAGSWAEWVVDREGSSFWFWDNGRGRRRRGPFRMLEYYYELQFGLATPVRGRFPIGDEVRGHVMGACVGGGGLSKSRVGRIPNEKFRS